MCKPRSGRAGVGGGGFFLRTHKLRFLDISTFGERYIFHMPGLAIEESRCSTLLDGVETMRQRLLSQRLVVQRQMTSCKMVFLE